MKWLLIVIGVVAAGVVALVIYSRTLPPDKLTPEEERYNRRVYAQTVQDSMRDQAYGPSFSVKAAGDDEDILEIGFDHCDHDFLDTLVAAPSVSRALTEYGFYKVTCRGTRIEAIPDHSSAYHHH